MRPRLPQLPLNASAAAAVAITHRGMRWGVERESLSIDGIRAHCEAMRTAPREMMYTSSRGAWRILAYTRVYALCFSLPCAYTRMEAQRATRRAIARLAGRCSHGIAMRLPHQGMRIYLGEAGNLSCPLAIAFFVMLMKLHRNAMAGGSLFSRRHQRRLPRVML